MNKKANAFMIILLLGLIVAGGIFFIAYLNSIDDKKVMNETTNVTINYFDIYLSSNAKSKINYIIYDTIEKCEQREITEYYNDSITLEQTTIKSNQTFCFQTENNLLLRGMILENMIEEYKQVQENTSIIMQGYSDFYYFNKTTCDITQNNSYCTLTMDEKALDYVIILNETSLKINPFNKTIQRPLICWNWGYDIINIIMNLKSVEVPKEYRYKQTLCYQSENINTEIEIPFEIRWNPIYTTPNSFTVTIYDYEETGYNTIGSKYVGAKRNI